MPTLSKHTIGYGIAAVVAILGSTILTWVKEENPAVMLFMKQLMYHHWITHGVAVLAVFLVLGYVLSHAVRPAEGRWLTWALVLSSAAGALGLIAFFFFA